MKRKSDIENSGNEKREKPQPGHRGVGGDHPAWDIIIGKLDYKSQMKLSHQSHNLAKFSNWSFIKVFDSHMNNLFENSSKRKQ